MFEGSVLATSQKELHGDSAQRQQVRLPLELGQTIKNGLKTLTRFTDWLVPEPVTISNGAGALDVGSVLVVPFGQTAVCVADPGGNEKEPSENASEGSEGEGEEGPDGGRLAEPLVRHARVRHDGDWVAPKAVCVRHGAAPCRPHTYVASRTRKYVTIISDWYPRVDWDMGQGGSGTIVLLWGGSSEAQGHRREQPLAWSTPNRADM